MYTLRDPGLTAGVPIPFKIPQAYLYVYILLCMYGVDFQKRLLF